MSVRWLVERTAGLSTSLRFGRDDNSYFARGAGAQKRRGEVTLANIGNAALTAPVPSSHYAADQPGL